MVQVLQPKEVSIETVKQQKLMGVQGYVMTKVTGIEQGKVYSSQLPDSVFLFLCKKSSDIHSN